MPSSFVSPSASPPVWRELPVSPFAKLDGDGQDPLKAQIGEACVAMIALNAV
jgi:hypothetical protein